MAWSTIKTAIANRLNRKTRKIGLGDEIALLSASVAGGTLANGKILIGSAGGVATPQTLTGDVTVTNAGVTALAADCVDNAEIKDNAVSVEHLDSGIKPSHVIKYASQVTSVGGAPAEDFAVVGAAATDLIFVQLVDDGTNNVSVKSVVAALNKITVTFSADPGNDAIINYQVVRAVA